jgi:hypothetical protein
MQIRYEIFHIKNKKSKPGMVVHVCNAGIGEAEAGRWRVPG